MGFALDFSGARPTPEAVKATGAEGVLVYTGNYRPSDQDLDAYRAAGLTVVFIQESAATRAWQGYPAGVQDAQFADSRTPAGSLVYYNGSDTPNVAGHEQAISDYFRGVGETTREAIVGAYGSMATLDAARAGHPKVQRLWGVETWNPLRVRRGWDGYPLDLMQLANTASPIPNTDRDDILSALWARGEDVSLTSTQALQLTSIFADVTALWKGYPPAQEAPPAQTASTPVMLQQLLNRGPAAQGTVGALSTGDVDRIATRVADLLHDRLAS